MKNIDNLLGGLLGVYEQQKTTHKLNVHEQPITVSYVKNKLMRKYGISSHHLYKIFFHMINVQNKSKFLFSNILTNPFDFVTPEEILIPFAIADNINTTEKLGATRSTRYKCWIYEHLLETAKTFYACPKRLKSQMAEYFENETKTKAFVDKTMVRHGQKVTMAYYERLESTLQQRVTGLTYPLPYDAEEVDRYISEYKDLSLTSKQSDAIHKCIANNLHIVCGYPGTGKSTIVQLFSSFLKQKGLNVYFTAPTGLAIKGLLSKLKGHDPECCGTLHKLIYTVFPYIQNEGDTDAVKCPEDENKIVHPKPDVIIIDEFSMVDTLMLKHLIKVCIRFKCRLYIFGDSNQLPPVGAGNPLRRLSQSDRFRDHITYLTEIKRQTNEVLLSNIHRVNDGAFILDEHFDQQSMWNVDYETLLCPKTKQVDYERLSAFIRMYDLDVHRTQFLSPENKKNCGIQQLNLLLQRFYNKGPFIPNTEFKVNDFVVRTQNKYETETGRMYANGDMGKITQLIKAYPSNNVVIEYETSDISDVMKEEVSVQELEHEFQLRYCLSIHKSQGSEYDNVVLFMGNPHKTSSWNQGHAKKLLYTAMSRTKQKCFIVSNKGLLNIAQATLEEDETSNFF